MLVESPALVAFLSSINFAMVFLVSAAAWYTARRQAPVAA